MKYLRIFAIAIAYFATSAAFAHHLETPYATHKVPKGKIPKNQIAPKNPAPPAGEVNTKPPKNLYDEHYKAD